MVDERRILYLEERTRDLVQEVATHSAVDIERQKMILNTLASIEGQISKLDDRMTKLTADVHTRIDIVRTTTSKRLDGWLAAIAGAGIMSTGSLVLLIVSRGLK